MHLITTLTQKKRVKASELIIFTRQLALMLRAGIPITSALNLLVQQRHSNPLHNAINTLIERIHEGESIASGMSQSPNCFPPFYTTLIAAGEHAGILDQTLDTLSDQLEEQRALRSRMIRAAIYPAIVCITLAAITLFLLTWVVPTFEDLFKESGVPLPWLTRVIIGISALLARYWMILATLILAMIALVSLRRLQNRPTLSRFERLTKRMPIWRTLICAKHTSECSTLLAALIRVGIPIFEGLKITAQTTHSPSVAAALEHVRYEVSEGKPLSTAFRGSGYFPELFSHLIEVGESSGKLEALLIKAAHFYHAQVEQTIDALKQLVEPALMLIIGLIVGITVLALYLPIFQIGELAGMR
jgi:type IV pilus assembly protein PilC